ncbi:hypothetical protein EW146_g104 [Bondarzewia mesenterica]|uniref:Kinase n=1 Tax=Bondarzewia mesenterica TaxID=1095465 RepID=A0A4S4MAA4_9AGAM|nr:hypothetical protein EW146_g104 [Bondarzewia mesenterica]
MSTDTIPLTTTVSVVQALDNQVGGHAGVQTTEDGSLLIKLALPLEHQFYQTTVSDPAVAPLLPWIPKFYGTLRLSGYTSADGTIVPTELLENLSHPFVKPNILDIKLGTVLYDESASPKKRSRMEETARLTTSLETGVRLTGFQVFDNTTSTPIPTPKSYGKSIKPADLPTGISRFFPIASPTSPQPAASIETDGIQSISEAEGEGESSGEELERAVDTGLPASTLLPILESITRDVHSIREALNTVEMRMVGGSLLLMYEADWVRAEQGVQWLGAHPDGVNSDSESSDEDEDEEGDDEEEGKGMDLEVEMEIEEEEGTVGRKKPGAPYAVRLIDFAHMRLKPGEGPDVGVLKGVDTTLQLLEGRLEEVRSALAHA